MSLAAPSVLGVMARMMLQPPQDIVARYAIPPEVVAEAFTDNPEHRERVVAAMSKLRLLCEELGLMNPEALAIWRAGDLLPIEA